MEKRDLELRPAIEPIPRWRKFNCTRIPYVIRQLYYLHLQAACSAEALYLYRLVAADFCVMTGSARVHEAAALEMEALAPALAERALCISTLRPACLKLIRASIAVTSAPKIAIPTFFVDIAATALHVAAALSPEATSLKRCGALHVFLAAARFK